MPAALADAFFRWGFPNVTVFDDNTLELANKAIEHVARCTPTLLASQTPQLSRAYTVNDGLVVTIAYAEPFLDIHHAIALAKNGEFAKLYRLCRNKLRHNEELKMEMLSAHYQGVDSGRQSLYDQLCYWVDYIEKCDQQQVSSLVSAEDREGLEYMCTGLGLNELYFRISAVPTASSFVNNGTDRFEDLALR